MITALEAVSAWAREVGGPTMKQMSADFRAEALELRGLLETLTPEQWADRTLFMDWSVWDVVAHLHFYDENSMLAATDAEAFKAHVAELIGSIMKGVSSTEQTRQRYAGVDHAALLSRWDATNAQLAEQLGTLDPKARLPWYGPDMSARMFTTARLMETWAHAQAIYDLVGVERVHTDRIKHIATIGVKTFGWTFINRKLEVPGAAPYVRLTSPTGDVWEWGEPSETERITGDAVGFCQTVTQTRNVADVELDVVGDVAKQWMSIAQCFAGGAVDPPKPGLRVGS